MTNRARNEFLDTFDNAATKHAGVTKRAGRTSQYDTGDKIPEKGPSLTFLAPVRLGGAREAYRKFSRIRGRSNR